MSTAIEWTDETWNPTTGCTKISPGCAHCYIERTPPFRKAGRRFGDKGHIPIVFHDDDRLATPTTWKRPRRVFVNSLSDLFHTDIPDAFIDRVFAVMAQTERHTYQVLTKRAERMLAYYEGMAALDDKARARRVLQAMYEDHPARRLVLTNVHDAHLGGFPWPLPNVWQGVSVENQVAANRIDPLLLTRAAVRFLSVEPLLEPIALTPWLAIHPRPDWVIVGGESGPGARPCHVDWIRSVVQQCQRAGVSAFVKQLGSHVLHDYPTRGVATRYTLHDKKGGDLSEFPYDLRVREFPRGATA